MDNAEKGPLFIAGLDRTGKTRLSNLLSVYPHISITRRTYMWHLFYDRFGDLRKDENLERCLSAMLERDSIRRLNPDLERIRQEFRQGERSYARLFGLFHQHYAESLGKTRWGDQLGFVEMYADQIFQAFPNARMIHMIRHPRCRYEEALPSKSKKQGSAGISLARWIRSARLAQRNEKIWPDNYLVVQYEPFLELPGKVLRDICYFIGEDYLPDILSHQPDVAPQNGRISASEKAFIHVVARRPMSSLGYQPEKLLLSPKETLALFFYDGPVNLAGMLFWYLIGSRQPEKP